MLLCLFLAFFLWQILVTCLKFLLNLIMDDKQKCQVIHLPGDKLSSDALSGEEQLFARAERSRMDVLSW